MKPATKAIIILSALLAGAGGWIVYSTVTGDRILKEKLQAAQDNIDAAIAAKETLKASNALKDELAAEQAATIAGQAVTIASLQAHHGGAQDVADVAVGQGATVKEWYASGEPLVKQIGIDALSAWYTIGGLKIDPLVATLADLRYRIALMGPDLSSLIRSNSTLSDENTRIRALNVSDKATIEALGANLEGAARNIDAALTRARTGEWLAWTLGGAAVGALAGAAAGKDFQSAAIGAGAGAAAGAGLKLTLQLALP